MGNNNGNGSDEPTDRIRDLAARISEEIIALARDIANQLVAKRLREIAEVAEGAGNQIQPRVRSRGGRYPSTIRGVLIAASEWHEGTGFRDEEWVKLDSYLRKQLMGQRLIERVSEGGENRWRITDRGRDVLAVEQK